MPELSCWLSIFCFFKPFTLCLFLFYLDHLCMCYLDQVNPLSLCFISVFQPLLTRCLSSGQKKLSPVLVTVWRCVTDNARHRFWSNRKRREFKSLVICRSAAGFTWNNALPLHSDVLVPVFAGVFVMQAQSVNELMAKVPNTTWLGVIHHLGSSLTANKGRTARETNTSRSHHSHHHGK